MGLVEENKRKGWAPIAGFVSVALLLWTRLLTAPKQECSQGRHSFKPTEKLVVKYE